ncbi:MAG: hypothetical protein RJA36_3537 [Pseudomonadota bacterium]
MKVPEILDVPLHPAFVAALGSILALKAIPGTSYVEKAGNVGASFAMAIYIGPALVEYMDITSPKIAAAVIFAIGATGLVVFNGVIDAIKKTDLAAWVAGWLPGRKGGQ